MRSRLKYLGLGALLGITLVVGTAAVASDFRLGRAMEIFINLFREISTSYVDPTDPDKLLHDAAEGLTAGLDPYTQFLDESDLEGFEAMTTGKYAGIGSAIRQRGDTVLFSEPYKGSPADRAGIHIGDAVVEIDGKTAVGIGSEAVSALLKGDVGSSVKVTYKRLADGEERTATIRREMIIRSGIVYSAMLNERTGYINHSDFTENCSADFRSAVERLMTAGAQKLIIDERGNGGGILQEAVKILSLFVPRGTMVVEMRGRTPESNKKFYTEREPIAESIELVVLINEGTASAAEIVAGALQDLGRATLVGRRSFGKGLVQSTRSLGYNIYIKLTTARYYLPSGRTIERSTGLAPDIVTEGEPMSRLAYEVYGAGYIDDFADNYWRNHQTLTIADPAKFSITEADWDDFKRFIALRTEEDIEPSRSELTIMLTGEIIMRYCYVEGLYKYTVARDRDINETQSI